MFCQIINQSYVFVQVLLNPKQSLLFAVAVKVGAVQPAHLIVANHQAIVLTVLPCVMFTIKHWLLVTLLTAKVMAVPLALPVTSCILLTEQSIVTVCAQLQGVYVLATSALAADTILPVIVPQANGNADLV
jgi:hypothetical protein